MQAITVRIFDNDGDPEHFQDVPVYIRSRTDKTENLVYISEARLILNLLVTPQDIRFDIEHAVAEELGIKDSLVRMDCNPQYV